MAADMGIERLTEEHYRELQKTWKFRYDNFELDPNASAIRRLGGASFVTVATARSLCITNGAESTMPQGIPRLAKGLNFAQ